MALVDQVCPLLVFLIRYCLQRKPCHCWAHHVRKFHGRNTGRAHSCMGQIHSSFPRPQRKQIFIKLWISQYFCLPGHETVHDLWISA